MPEASTVDDLVDPESDHGRAYVRSRRRTYVVTSVALGVLMLLVVVDAWAPVFGVDSAVVTADGPDGLELRVEHPAVVRPALAAPFAVEVTRPGGFDGPIRLAISRPWIESWDENAWYPAPASEVGERDWVVYVFDPPEGDTLRVFYDARMEPARQQSVDGAVELRGQDGVLASVSFTTTVRP